jgi:hypothetical protein
MSDSITLTGQTNGTVTLTGGSGGTLIFQGVSQGIKGDKGDQGDPATNLVTSVAGKTGAVSLTKDDVGLSNVDNTSDADKPVSTATQTALDAKATITALDAHTNNTANPHSVTKAQVGLGNVQNLAPADMPVSTDTQTALDAKANASDTVNLTGNQTVAGVKTFSSSPIVPTATTNTQAVNKSQMDTADALKVNKAGDTMTGRLASQSTILGFAQSRAGKNITFGASSNGDFQAYNDTDGNNIYAAYSDGTGLSFSSSGTQIRYGTGFPEGIVTAPVGSIYIGKSVTNGASSWIKKSGTGNTGWQVLEGDTGWRNINSLLGSFWQSGVGAFAVRRIGATVFVRVDGVKVAASPTGARISARSLTDNMWPTGFKQSSWGGFLSSASLASFPGNVLPMATPSDLGVRVFGAGLSSTGNWTLDDYIAFQYQYATNEAWPTTLPGTAA